MFLIREAVMENVFEITVSKGVMYAQYCTLKELTVFT